MLQEWQLNLKTVVFKEAFEKQVQDTITDNLRVQEIEIDAEINFTDITLS
jgi:single-stranded-DNA-specific exonuclease